MKMVCKNILGAPPIPRKQQCPFIAWTLSGKMKYHCHPKVHTQNNQNNFNVCFCQNKTMYNSGLHALPSDTP
eukprot:2900854-Amphidinium_carterae.1